MTDVDLNFSELRAYFCSFLEFGLTFRTGDFSNENYPSDLRFQMLQLKTSFISGLYWTLAGLGLACNNYQQFIECIEKKSSRQQIVDLISSCLRADGGFAAFPDKLLESDVLSTCSAIQCLTLFHSTDEYKQRTSEYFHDFFKSGPLLKADGEADIRQCYSALLGLQILNSSVTDVPIATALAEWLLACVSPVCGGIGVRPHQEPHAGFALCWVGSASILLQWGILSREMVQRLSQAWQHAKKWLLLGFALQNVDGGLCGRPNKDSDSCYGFWVFASLRLGMESFEEKAHEAFISELAEQYDLSSFVRYQMLCYKSGGFSKHEKGQTDPFHSFMAANSLCLLYFPNKISLKSVLPKWSI